LVIKSSRGVTDEDTWNFYGYLEKLSHPWSITYGKPFKFFLHICQTILLFGSGYLLESVVMKRLVQLASTHTYGKALNFI
jgi:hypothetical protein